MNTRVKPRYSKLFGFSDRAFCEKCGSIQAKANKARSQQREKLVQTIEKLKSVAQTSPLVTPPAKTEGASANVPMRAVGIFLDEFPEAFYGIIKKNFEHLVEMQCDLKTLERLLFYLNFYRQPTDAVAPLRETAQSLVREGRRTIRVVAFGTTVLEPKIDSELLENPSFKKKVFFTTDPLEVFDLERLLFIESSRALIHNGDLRCFKTAPGLRALARLVKLKSWMLTNFSEDDIHKFIIINSTVLFSFGIRVSHDIDLFVHRDVQDRAFLRRFQKALKASPEGLFSSIDIVMGGYKQWSENKDIFNRNLIYEWPQSFGARDMNEVIDDPRFHYYFLGLKCVSLKGDIEMRVRLTRPSSYADLFYMQRQKRIANTWSITISALTDYIDERSKWVFLPKEERHGYFERVHNSLKSRYGISMRIEEIQEAIEKGVNVEPLVFYSHIHNLGDDSDS